MHQCWTKYFFLNLCQNILFVDVLSGLVSFRRYGTEIWFGLCEGVGPTSVKQYKTTFLKIGVLLLMMMLLVVVGLVLFSLLLLVVMMMILSLFVLVVVRLWLFVVVVMMLLYHSFLAALQKKLFYLFPRLYLGLMSLDFSFQFCSHFFPKYVLHDVFQSSCIVFL